MRRTKPQKRVPAPDAIYNDTAVAKFINRLMVKGKKSVAQLLLMEALEQLDGKTPEAPDGSREKPIDAFRRVLKRVAPKVKVKARRVGGATYQVPMEVSEQDGEALGSRWLIAAARKRAGRSMADKLANEMLDILKGQGAALKKREETHRMAEANRAFAHFRF
ncbi:MAG: 30S ribosomal protein S7 [Vampirovibrionales bacterium]|nr:30S ribosomal protein S7 [Vampirovibrionales bacterium]